jgi:hypothetical protein
MARELVYRDERRDWDTRSDVLAQKGLAASPASNVSYLPVIGQSEEPGGRSKWRVDPFGAYVVRASPEPYNAYFLAAKHC